MTRYLIALAAAWTLGGCIFSPDEAAPMADLAPACGPGFCNGCCHGGMCLPGSLPISCGTGGQPCQQCNAVQTCLSNQSCGLNLSERWALIVEEANIKPRRSNGQAWDPRGGAPDPYVTFGGSNKTSVKQDTLSPSWKDDEGSMFELTNLVNGVNVSVLDDDTDIDDQLAGSKTLVVTESELLAGKIMWTDWDSVASITFILHKGN